MEDKARLQRRSAPAIRRHDPRADYLGLRIPDPELKWNEAGHYDFGEIDWGEFWSVVKGNGPMNRDRVEHKVRAWDEGAWVREAALAHAKKKVGQRGTA